MASLADVIRKTKTNIGLASGVTIIVRKATHEIAHGRTQIHTHGLDKLLAENDLLDMRVGTFCDRFGRCIGAQIGATVRIEFAGQTIDGRVALKTLA